LFQGPHCILYSMELVFCPDILKMEKEILETDLEYKTGSLSTL